MLVPELTHPSVGPRRAGLKEETREISRPFVPEPGTHRFELFLRRLLLLGLEPVGIGRRWGPRVPRVRSPTDGAPDLLELDRDMQRVVGERDAWAQPWYPRCVTAENRDDTVKRAARWEPAALWHPGRRPSMQLSASASARLSGHTHQEIGEYLGLTPELVSHKTDAYRFRPLPEIIKRGDRLWASLGAWPWAAFPAEIPNHWWQEREATEVLRRACETVAREKEQAALEEAARADALLRLARSAQASERAPGEAVIGGGGVPVVNQ